ncbi:MAG: hypothetical protein ACLFTY_02190 [Candidatus Aenigmatarchaeota archaeon]
MSSEFSGIKEPLENILEKLQDEDFISEKNLKPAGFQDEVRVTVENLEVWAGNHLFDNYPEDFDIDKDKGREIRAYFQEGLINRDYDFVAELYEEFPDKLDGEREGYVDDINEYRERNDREAFQISGDGKVLRDD